MVTTKKNNKIVTFDSNKNINGFLIPIININEELFDKYRFPNQIYLTVAKPGTTKGPHLHMKRYGMFTCIKGNAKIVVKNENGYEEYYTGEDYDFSTILVPPGTPNMIVNICDEDCYILNSPYPSWSKENQDDWKVEDWDYKV